MGKEFDKDLVVIDIAQKGNVVRFYLGKKEGKWGWTNPDYRDGDGKVPDWLRPSDTYYGDDWDDAPYQHNAGPVYDEFIRGFIDISFPYDCTLITSVDDADYTPKYTMNDVVDGKIPALLVFPATFNPWQHRDYDNYPGGLFDQYKNCTDTKIVERIYLGDGIDRLLDISKREDM